MAIGITRAIGKISGFYRYKKSETDRDLFNKIRENHFIELKTKMGGRKQGQKKTRPGSARGGLYFWYGLTYQSFSFRCCD
jgi:hypothetical protein